MISTFRSTLRFAALVCIVISIDAGNVSAASRKIRVHFTAASFAYAKDTATNAQLDVSSSRAGFDIVWEGTAPSDQFPVYFDPPHVLTASGQSNLTVKFGAQQNCTGNLVYNPSANPPSVNIYHRGDGKVAIKLITPHQAGAGGPNGIIGDKSAIIPCGGTLFTHWAYPAEGVTEEHEPLQALPNDLGSSLPPDVSAWAAFETFETTPNTTIHFRYVQSAKLNGTYESKSVWFGSVVVEADPFGPIPGPTDPFSQFGYVAPPPGGIPADPPKFNVPPPGNDPVVDFKNWLKIPLLDQLKKTVDGLENKWSSLGGKKSLILVKAKVKAKYTYNKKTNTLVITSLSGAPADGSLNVYMGAGKSALAPAGTGIPIYASAANTITLKLPASVKKALGKGKKAAITLSATITPAGGSPVTETKAFSLKAR